MRRSWREVLTSTQRKSILRGNRPTLSWNSAPSLENGDIVVIQTRKGMDAGRGYYGEERIRLSAVHEGDVVTLTINSLKRNKTGAFIATYTLRDDRARFLAPGNGYTTERLTSIDPDAEVVPLVEMVAREKAAEGAILRERQRLRAETVRLESRLNEVRHRGMSGAERAIAQQLGRVQELVARDSVRTGAEDSC